MAELWILNTWKMYNSMSHIFKHSVNISYWRFSFMLDFRGGPTLHFQLLLENPPIFLHLHTHLSLHLYFLILLVALCLSCHGLKLFKTLWFLSFLFILLLYHPKPKNSQALFFSIYIISFLKINFIFVHF